MEAWCVENLRDCEAWRAEKLPLTNANDEAAKLYDSVIRQLVSWTDCSQLGGIAGSIQRMREAQPTGFPMGKVLELALDALGTGKSAFSNKQFDAQLGEILAEVRASNCTEREIWHAQAAEHFGRGRMRSACIAWEKILTEHPNDLLAVKLVHDAYFYLGDHEGKRDSVRRVMGKWSEGSPGYGYLHGMLAFGLEECGQYEESLKHARIGLSLNQHDCWSTHAIAHCFEMKSQFHEGLQFLESTLDDWRPGNILAGHNYWHQALFHIEADDIESALTVFDQSVSPEIQCITQQPENPSIFRENAQRARSSGTMLDLVDASSLLMRLEFQGVEVGRERWNAILCVATPHIADHALVFNDAHISMVLAGAGDSELLERHKKSRSDFVTTVSKDNTQAQLMLDIGEAVCEAIVDFKAERYEHAFRNLYVIRSQLFRIGGSHAQLDLLTQLLINAGLRSTDAEQRAKTLYAHAVWIGAVIEEREVKKPGSPLTQRYLELHRQG